LLVADVPSDKMRLQVDSFVDVDDGRAEGLTGCWSMLWGVPFALGGVICWVGRGWVISGMVVTVVVYSKELMRLCKDIVCI